MNNSFATGKLPTEMQETESLSPINAFFLKQNEPVKSCLHALRYRILLLNNRMNESWSYGMPLYSYAGKRLCYLWTHKKFKVPYILFVDGKFLDHPDLLSEKRSRMKILLIDPLQDFPEETLSTIFTQLLTHY